MRALALATMPRRLPPGSIEDRDRHGNIRIYYRAKGRRKVRLRGTPWTSEFMAEYQAAKGEAAPMKAKGIASGTWRWLVPATLRNALNTSALTAGHSTSAGKSSKRRTMNQSLRSPPSFSAIFRFAE